MRGDDRKKRKRRANEEWRGGRGKKDETGEDEGARCTRRPMGVRAMKLLSERREEEGGKEDGGKIK